MEKHLNKLENICRLCQSQYQKVSQKNFGNFWIFLKMKVIWPLEVKSGFWAWGHSKYGPWDPQNCQTQYQKVSQKNFGNFWICCQIEVNLIHLKVKLGLLASGKLKYGTLDSQKQPYTVRTILGNFRWLNFLDARFLLGLYCVSETVAGDGRWSVPVNSCCDQSA